MVDIVEAQQRRVVSSADYLRLPWWTVAGRSAIMFGMGMVAEFGASRRSAFFAVLSLLWVVLEEQTGRRIGLAGKGHTFRSNLIRVGPMVVWLLVLVFGSKALGIVGVRLPILITAAVLAVVMALLAQPLQRAYYASLRRGL